MKTNDLLTKHLSTLPEPQQTAVRTAAQVFEDNVAGVGELSALEMVYSLGRLIYRQESRTRRGKRGK